MRTKRLPIRDAELLRPARGARSVRLMMAVLTVGFLLGSVNGSAQIPERGPRAARAAAAAQKRQAKQPAKQPGVHRPATPQGPAQGKEQFVQKLSSLPADQQEKLIKNSQTFQNLPAGDQQRIIDAVHHWNAAGRPPGGLQGMIEHDHPAAFFQQLREMPPDEQERVMHGDAHFQSLPPDRQQQVRNNLSRWNAATPEERQMLLQREEIVQSFSPEQRDQLRQVFPRYRQLTPEGRQSVMQTFQKLRNLPPGERDKFLNSPEVQQLSPDERGIVSDLKSLLPEK